MAIAFVQKSTELFADNASSISPSRSGTTAGNEVVLTVSVSNFGTTSPAPAIGAPSGWSTARADSGPTGSGDYRPTVGIFYKENIAGGTENPTVTTPSGSYSSASISEYSGLATSSSLDVTQANLASSGTSGNTGTTGTTAQADELVIALIHPEDTIGATSALSTPASSGYTNIDTEAANNVHIAYDANYKIVSSTGTQTASWTWTTSSFYTAAIATFKAAAAAATDIAPNPTDELPPIGPDFNYELRGWQQEKVVADNSEGWLYNDALPPTGRNYDYELAGFQYFTLPDDNDLAASINLHDDLAPIGRDFKYELAGWQHSANDQLTELTQPGNAWDALPPIGRDFDFELEGWQHPPIEAIATVPISIVQQTTPLFFDGVTSASQTINGVTAGNFLIAFFPYADVDNSSSKAPPDTPSGWTAAENPSGPIDANAWMGQAALYYKENVAGGSHTIDFPVLRPSTLCEITIVEVAGIRPSSSLDVHTFAKSPNNTTVTSGQVGPTSPSTFANSIVFALIGVSGGGASSALTHPATSAYSSVDGNTENSAHIAYSSSYKITSATGAQQANWTWTGASNYTAVLATFMGTEEVPPPLDIAANWTANAPLGRDFEYELEGWQAAPLAIDNDVGQGAVSFEQLPIGRDFDYQLEGYQFGVVGPDFTGADAIATGQQDFEPFVIGDDFDYQLEGFQQGVVGANADQSNVIPMWFEVPQTVVNYGYHLAPYFFAGVGPDGIPPHSEPTQLTSNPPVLYIPEVEEWFHLPIGPDAAPALTSNVTRFYDNPPTFLQLFVDIDSGFQYPGVGPDSGIIPTSTPSVVDDLPMVFVRPQPSYDSSISSGVRADANFTDATHTAHFTLPAEGKNFDWELQGFFAQPLPIDNTIAIAAAYFELPPSGRDFDYELRAHQDTPLAEENELAYSLANFELTPEGRNFDYALDGFQLSEILIDSIIEPVGLSIQHFNLAQEGRNFDYELGGFQSPPVGPDTLDTYPFSALAHFALPPEGRNFDFDLAGFQSPPLAADFFEPFFLAGMDFPAWMEPKHDERDIHPFLGQQVPAIRGEVLPFNNSGPSQYIPTLRPRRR